MSMTILIAPSGFKENLSPSVAADRIAEGARRAMPHARLIKAPVVDGGEGFTEALVTATGGSLHGIEVSGPVGQRLPAFFGLLGDGGRSWVDAAATMPEPRTAVIEVAAAAGLRRVPVAQRDPLRTCSRGVGEMIRAALDAGARRILLGCGDSGINDGGAGMVQALGARLLDVDDRPIGPGGGELRRLARIDLSGLDPRLAHTRLDAAVNAHNQLLGERGVSHVYGPQKGAGPAQVEALEQAMRHYAGHLHRATGINVAAEAGAGASGGLGAGFRALLGGHLLPRYEVVMNYLDLDALIARADLVITAEGQLDGQTCHGKVPAEVARRAKRRGLPVIALAGSLGPGAASTRAAGIDASTSILRRPCSLEDAYLQAGEWLSAATEDALRFVQVGMVLGQVRQQRLGPQADAPERRALFGRWSQPRPVCN